MPTDGNGWRKSESWDREYTISGVVAGSIGMQLSINRKPLIDTVSSLLVDVHQNVGVLMATCGGVVL